MSLEQPLSRAGSAIHSLGDNRVRAMNNEYAVTGKGGERLSNVSRELIIID
jgi:hypothetical protein